MQVKLQDAVTLNGIEITGGSACLHETEGYCDITAPPTTFTAAHF